MTITWKIEQLDRRLADGTVLIAHWRVTAVEDNLRATAYGTCGFTRDPEAPGFIPYDELTEDIVLGWCFADGVDKDAYESSLTTQIEAQRNPVTSSGLPW